MSALARSTYRFANPLYSPFSIGESTFFFGKTCRGKYHIGKLSCLVGENILHNEELNFLQHFFYKMQIRIGNHGVFAHNIEETNIPFSNGIKYLWASKPGLIR